MSETVLYRFKALFGGEGFQQTAGKAAGMIRYKGLKMAQVICAVYILVLTFSYYPYGLIDPSAPLGQWRIVDIWNPENTEAGVIQLEGDPLGPKRAVVAKDRISLICLAISRISAFTMYPCIFLAFMTKCKATINFLMTTPFSLYMVQDQHKLHSYCGKFIAIDIWVHTLFHCLRWGLQGNIDLLWTHIAGITGIIALFACVLVCVPMMVERLRQLISYEVRKFLHTFFFYVFALAMIFHNKTSAWPNGGYNQVILGFCIIFYTLDALYVMFFMTEMIDTTVFNVLPSGVQMTLTVSGNFQRVHAQGGYGYVCLPWVSKNQWHAFSLFEHPSNPNLRQVFMLNVGNWTKEVHAQLQRNTVRPAWIQGPFLSPYNNALAFDNTICVATGIGITPALSVIRAHRESRRINLIWACRDVAMLEFFMDHLWLNNDGWILIFYTGKEELSPAVENAKLNSNIKLIKSRPNFDTIIPNIIFGIETGTCVPEAAVPSEKLQVRELIAKKVWEFESEGLKEDEIIEELTFLAHEKGFLLSRLVDERAEDRNKSLLQVIKEQFAVYSNSALRRSGTSIPELTGLTASRRRSGSSIPELTGLTASRSSTSIPELAASAHSLRGSSTFIPELSASAHSLRGSSTSISELASASASRTRSYRGLLKRHKHINYTKSKRFERRSSVIMRSRPWEDQPESEEFVLALDKKRVLNTWGLLYCGGSKHVESSLRKISKKYDLKLHTEAFAW